MIFETPYILIDLAKIKENLNFYKRVLDFSSESIYYPIKVNSQKEIIDLLNSLSCNFEVGALTETKYLKNNGINPIELLFGNPVKSAFHVQQAYELGVRNFGVDSENELKKISNYAPLSNVYFRIDIDNTGAEWALKGKFGININEVAKLFNFAQKYQLQPLGISFHLGWNNPNEKTWKSVFEKINKWIIDNHKKTLVLKTINIGGGFPAHLNNQYADLEKIAKTILPFLNNWRENGIHVLAEPGSFLIANAGVLYTSVIEIIKRKEKTWVFVDNGVFQGFYWILGGLKYHVESLEKNSSVKLKQMIVCGPTCDTHDVFSDSVLLPENIKIGDILVIHPAGAYINSAQNYNGFAYPKQIVIND